MKRVTMRQIIDRANSGERLPAHLETEVVVDAGRGAEFSRSLGALIASFVDKYGNSVSDPVCVALLSVAGEICRRMGMTRDDFADLARESFEDAS